jgi:hypothetical protein
VDIDLNSSHWKSQLPMFISLRPQPGAAAVNDFHITGLTIQVMRFPSSHLLFGKLRRQKANLVMICPLWPSKPWFLVLLEPATAPPRTRHTSQPGEIETIGVFKETRIPYRSLLFLFLNFYRGCNGAENRTVR